MIRSVTVDRDGIATGSYPFSIPAIGALTTLELHPQVTLLAGENGSGKSTLIEAIAVAAGFNPEGGSRNMRYVTRPSHSELHERLHIVRDARTTRDGWFLRAESSYNIATHIEQLGVSGYGEASLHEQSHGESFLSLVLERFGDRGLYILDEPEAALSVRGVLALIRRMHELAGRGSQFLLSTHSPILLAYAGLEAPAAKPPAPGQDRSPSETGGALVYVLDEHGIAETPWEETEIVDLTRSFLADRGRFLHHLFA